MAEQIFKAPLPPEGTGFIPPSPPAIEPEPPQNSPRKTLDIKEKILPYLWYVLGGTFFVGLILGMIMASGGDTAPIAPTCKLQRLKNPDIQKADIPLCGRVVKSEACILYIMNTTPRDKLVKDYFEDAARLTSRSTYLISADNPVYSQYMVKPGQFAEIQIPKMR